MPTNRTDFRSRLDKVQSIISRGCLYHATWESLWPIDKEIRVLINFRDFFDPVRGALFEGILYNFERALSSNTSEDSLPNLLSMAINEPDNLMPYSKIKDIESMSSQIAQDQRTLENLQLMRRQHLVHLEEGQQVQNARLLVGLYMGLPLAIDFGQLKDLEII